MRALLLEPCLLAAISVVCACGATPRPAAEGGPTATAPSALDAAAAATRVADIRCQHEAACNNVGAGRRYATAQDCIAELSRSAQSDLGPRVCPTGVDTQRLGSCALQFARESCEPLAPLGRMYACDPAVLCSRPRGVTFSAADAYGM